MVPGKCFLTLAIILVFPILAEIVTYRENEILTIILSLTLDTACSSSIYCLHLAVAALKASQCDGAIVAASNLIMTPAPHIAAMKAGMLSPTSTCHTFDISADGYARGEGVDAIYLKRLSSAIQNNDNIHAIIRGTAINS